MTWACLYGTHESGGPELTTKTKGKDGGNEENTDLRRRGNKQTKHSTSELD